MSATLVSETSTLAALNRPCQPRKIWIDLDNSPHVPFFRPILQQLEKQGHTVCVTARDAYQVQELLAYYGICGRMIGKHHGKIKLLKAIGTCARAWSLSIAMREEKPDISVSHGSRSCLIASHCLGIPTIMLTDYEFVAKVPLAKPTWLMVPSVIPGNHFNLPASRVMKYPGIKEDVYLPSFRPDPSLRSRLGISNLEVLVVIRPPATEAHYHNAEAEDLLEETIQLVLRGKGVRGVLLPRNKRQEVNLRATWGKDLSSRSLIIPEQVEDGLNLIWNSDLVISGGGTMNREAAAMGVPVYSIFRGKIGAVDQYLAKAERLVLLETRVDVRNKVRIVQRERSPQRGGFGTVPALEAIIQNIASVLETQIPAKAY